MTESVSSTVLSVGAIVVLVGLSAFFSSSETAIFTVPDDWIDEQATRGTPAGATLHTVVRNYFQRPSA